MRSETCLHCWGETAVCGRCDECGEPVCTGCIERSAECPGGTLPQIEDLVDFLAHAGLATMATLHRLATKRLARPHMDSE